MSPEQRFKILARSLPESPSEMELVEIAQALAAAAERATESPGRKAALLVRHHLSARVAAATAARVRTMATNLLPDVPRHAPAIPPEPTWVTLEQAALILGQPAAYLLARLPDPVWRRAWGWPRWVGPSRRNWHFARAAVDGATAAAVLATQPVEEPPYPLPPWCHAAASTEGPAPSDADSRRQQGDRTFGPDVRP